MKGPFLYRSLWLAFTAGLVLGLLWLDHNRGGPASMLSRCNLLLSRSASRPADVLIVGSSRSGTALDPLAMQEMLTRALAGASPSVERIALGSNPERPGLALLENYLRSRGAPRVIALELMFETERTVDHLAQRGLALPPEQYIFRRDINLLTFKQILNMPSVAMPFSEGEGLLNLWRFRMRGIVLRAGALIYEFLRHPTDTWELSACDSDAWTREPEWPADFSFSLGRAKPDAPPAEVIEAMEADIAEHAPSRKLKPWQSGLPAGRRYPYDFGARYREGEVALLRSMLELADSHDVPVVLLPLPLYAYTASAEDLSELGKTIPTQAEVFDLYGQVRGDLDKFWYDDAHIERRPAGLLTTAILAQHLLDTGLLTGKEMGARND